MFEPMSSRSMCGHERFSSSAVGALRPGRPCASVRQWSSSLSLPEPAMIEAMSTRVGNAFLMRPMRGTHQSSGLSEMSSQFHDECSDAAAAACSSTGCRARACVRRNFVLGPATLTTGCMPIVLVTTPPQPASKARRMLLSDSVGGADESRNGFSKRMPGERHRKVDCHGMVPYGERGLHTRRAGGRGRTARSRGPPRSCRG